MASEIIANYDFTSFNTDTATKQECIDIVDSLSPWKYGMDYLRDTLLDEAMNEDFYSLSPTAGQIAKLDQIKSMIKHNIDVNKANLLNTYDDSYICLHAYILTENTAGLSFPNIAWRIKIIKRDVLKSIINSLSNISSGDYQYYAWKQNGKGWSLYTISNNDTTKTCSIGTGVQTSLDGMVEWWDAHKDAILSPSTFSNGNNYFVVNEPWETLQSTSYRFRAIAGFFVEEYDRYNPSGTENSTSGKYPSGEMGGLGTFDDSTDLSDISSKPSMNLSDLGFFSVWNPTSAQLRTLADYVWNDPGNIASWPQIFRDGIIKPMDYIISLALYPFDSTYFSKYNTTFCMGGIPFDGGITALGMTLTMDKITEQFIDINMGTVDLKEYFGSFLDYAPYSQISLYLPYYGVVQLSMNEVQNADSIKVLYRVNILDGSTAIKVHIDRQTSASQNGSVPLKHVLYEYFTNLKTEIPLTSGASAEQMKMLATVMSATITAAAPIAGAGSAALAKGAGEASGTMAGHLIAKNSYEIGQTVEKGIKAGAQGAQKAINAMPSGGAITRGNIGGMNTGLLSERRPFLIITRPIQVLPESYKEELGYTASIKTTLGALGSGFVKFDSVDLSSLDCEESERLKLLDILTNEGVYI